MGEALLFIATGTFIGGVMISLDKLFKSNGK